MKSRPPRRLIALLFAAGAFLTPFAGTASADDLKDDPRLVGFPKTVVLDVGVASAYMALGGLGIVCIGVMFKDAKRSHLD